MKNCDFSDGDLFIDSFGTSTIPILGTIVSLFTYLVRMEFVWDACLQREDISRFNTQKTPDHFSMIGGFNYLSGGAEEN